MKVLRSLIFIGIIIGSVFIYTLEPGPGPVVDPQLVQIWQDWQRDIDSLGIDVSHRIGRLERIQISYNMDSHVVGTSDINSQTILISHAILSQDPARLKCVVYHELGHHIFKLNHSEDLSIMNKKILPLQLLKQDWTRLKSEYLTQCKNEYNELSFRFE